MTTRGWLVGALCAAAMVAGTALGHAEEAAKAGLNAGGSMRDGLVALGEGRDVELVLGNGKSYRGKLGTVGKDTVIVTQIAGKEFYDVLIDLDDVAAVEVRVRGN